MSSMYKTTVFLLTICCLTAATTATKDSSGYMIDLPSQLYDKLVDTNGERDVLWHPHLVLSEVGGTGKKGVFKKEGKAYTLEDVFKNNRRSFLQITSDMTKKTQK